MSEEYTFRRADRRGDDERLRDFYNTVFTDEDVGGLAYTMLNRLPRLKPEHWMLLESSKTGAIAAGLVLIPWKLELCGVELEAAEMGIVGTSPDHRGRGLQRRLNEELDHDLKKGGYDIAMIQGIPGFYQRFGYEYAVPLENHVNVPLHAVPEGPSALRVRPVSTKDIPWLLSEDAAYRRAFDISVLRNEEDWHYLLTSSSETSYGSEWWVVESTEKVGAYFRVPREGFGEGLIVSEVSEDITNEEFASALSFCRRLAEKRSKPYIRLNVHNQSTPARLAYGYGASPGEPYAWQMKIPDPIGFLRNLSSLLNGRLSLSAWRDEDVSLELNLYPERIRLEIPAGSIVTVESVDPEDAAKPDLTCSLRASLFPSLALGQRTLAQMRSFYPDTGWSTRGEPLLQALFPPLRGWIHERY